MLSNKVLELLNQKINAEYFRSNSFLELSGWASEQSLDGVQGYFLNASQKALAQVNALVEYLNETGHEFNFGAIEEGLRDFDTVADLFTYVQELERHHKSDLHNLLHVCLEEKDFATFSKLESEVQTVHAEEFLIQTVLNKLQVLGTSKKGVYLVDKELSQQFPLPTPAAE